MPISGQESLNIGIINQATNSDDLYTAFHKVQNNFTRLFNESSSYNTFRSGDGISATSNTSSGIITITNTGVTRLIEGTGITLSNEAGNIIVSVSGDANGNIVAGVTSIGLNSTTLNVINGPVISNGNIDIELTNISNVYGFTPGQYTAPTITVDQYGRVTQINDATSVGTVQSIAVDTDGDGLSVTGSPITDVGTITLKNTGVTRLNAGSGISISGNTGEITISSIIQSSGTVSRVAVLSSAFEVTGSPITSAGVITVEPKDDLSLVGNLEASNGYFSTDVEAENITANANVNGVDFDATGNINVDGNAVVSGTLSAGDTSITGNLVVTGDVTYTNVVNMAVEDPMIEMGGGANNAALGSDDGKDRGQLLHYYSGSAKEAFIGWDNSNAEFVIASQVEVTDNVVTVNELGNIRVGNITVTSIETVGNISTGNLQLDGTLDVTGNANVGNIGSGGDVIAAANVYAGNISTSGTFAASGNANIGNVGTGIIIATGNITSSSFIGPYANGTSNIRIPTASGNLVVSVAGNANIITVTGTGVNVAGTFNTGAGNANVGNLGIGGIINVTGNATVGNLTTTGTVTAGTFTGRYANGNSNVNIPAANGNITMSVAGNANVIVVTGTGVNVAGTLNVTGNANVGNIGATGGVFTTVGGTLTTAAQPNITSVGTMTSITMAAGNSISGGNLLSANYISGTFVNGTSNVNIPVTNGNIVLTTGGNSTMIVTATGANIAGTIRATGNANVGNIGATYVIGGAVISTGNVTVANTGYLLMGTGAGLTGYLQTSTGSAVMGGTITAQNYIFSNVSLSATPSEGSFCLDAGNNRIGIYYSGGWHYASLTP